MVQSADSKATKKDAGRHHRANNGQASTGGLWGMRQDAQELFAMQNGGTIPRNWDGGASQRVAKAQPLQDSADTM